MSLSEQRSSELDRRPEVVSIVVPVFRTDHLHLCEMIDSVRHQSDDAWELILVDDNSGDDEIRAILSDYAKSDGRIIAIMRETNGGIGRATSVGLAAAKGEFVALLDHDDLLTPDAVEFIRRTASDHPLVDVMYSNEYRVDESGENAYRFLKPDYSPERLRAQMYFGHIVVYSARVLERIGGIREGFDGSQDYDLALRACEVAREVRHITRSLYKWRIHQNSVSHAKNNQYVFDAAIRALTEHLQRMKIDGTVTQSYAEGVYRIHRVLHGAPLVSIVIPTRGSSGDVRGRWRNFLTEAVRSIVQRSTYQNFELVVVWDTVTPKVVLDELRMIAGDRLRLIEYEGEFNFSAKINRGACAATGDYLLLLNDDVELIDPDWLEVMLAHFERSDVGMVGSLLYFEDGTVQHAGHLYEGGNAGHIAIGEASTWIGVAREIHVEREVSGVTAACALVRRELFFEVGGMSTTLPVNYNDVDLCLKIRQSGKRIIVTPYARLYHFESKSRKAGVHAHEWTELNDRWGREMIRDSFEPYPHRY